MNLDKFTNFKVIVYVNPDMYPNNITNAKVCMYV